MAAVAGRLAFVEPPRQTCTLATSEVTKNPDLIDALQKALEARTKEKK